MISSTQIQGKITELIVANEFLKLGYVVSQPLIDTRYDFIVDIKGSLKTIQVKTYWLLLAIYILYGIIHTKDGKLC